MHQIFGTNPSAFRKMFMRFSRTRTTAAVADVARAAQFGLPNVHESDVAALLGVSDAQQRVTYDSFAHAVALTALTAPARGAPRAAQEVQRARALGSAAQPQPPVGTSRAARGPPLRARANSPSTTAAAAPRPAEQAEGAAAAAYSVPTESMLLLASTPPCSRTCRWRPTRWWRSCATRCSLRRRRPARRRCRRPGTGARLGPARAGRGGPRVAAARIAPRHDERQRQAALRRRRRHRAHRCRARAGGVRRAPAPAEHVLTADALQRLRKQLELRGGRASEAFLRMDRLRDALLTPSEVRAGLERAGVQLDDASFGRVYALMDPKGAGAVDSASFTRVLFPPDMHPDSKAFPFERGAPEAPKSLGTRRRSSPCPPLRPSPPTT